MENSRRRQGFLPDPFRLDTSRPPPEVGAVGVAVAAVAGRPTAWKAAALGELELADLTGESLRMADDG